MRHVRHLLLLVSLLVTPFAFGDEPEAGFQPLFNGKDLSGWEGNMDLWKVEDGKIVGDSGAAGIKQNEFLATRESYGDFELRFDFRLKDGVGNSGVQFRSKREPNSPAVSGYQADIGEKYWGCLYDEHRRNKVLGQYPMGLFGVKPTDWNSYIIRAVGPHITLRLNEITTVDYTEYDSKIDRNGIIALQVHSGPSLRVEFKNIRIKKLVDAR
jgi:hypothetical protein